MNTLIFLLFTACVLQAEALRVVVRDPSGAFIENATVRAGEMQAATTAQGEANFDNLPAGRIEVTIEAPGFTPYSTMLTLKTGRITLERTLPLAKRVDKVDVETDRLDPLSFGVTTLTEKEIALLPDDPDQFEEVLKSLAGPGAVFRIDGFRGGRLPPKDQIQSIKFRLTPYSAEEHDDGFMLVDVTTKPGLGEWHGSAAFAIGDDSFNARNAFAPRREPQQNRRFDFSLLGPLIRNRTSVSFHFSRNDGYDSRTSVGVLPDGPFATLTRLPQLFTTGGARFNHAAKRKHLLRGEYQYEKQERSQIGAFDLPERMSSNYNSSHLARLSLQSSVSERALNEFRMQHSWVANGSDSLTNAPAILVLGAFGRGGANQDASRTGRTLEVVDHFSFNRKKHGLRTGFQFDALQYTGRDFSNGFGVTTYPNLAAYVSNQPALMTRRSSDVNIDYSQFRLGVYVHDDIRLRQNLSLALGTRIEGMTQIGNKWNAAPRAGFAWAPFRRVKTTLRGGAGIFYQWYDASLYEQLLRLNGAAQVDLITSPLGARLPGYLRSAETLSMPYVLRTSFGMQQPLPGRINLMLDYRHERGLNQFRGLNVNPPNSGLGYLIELDSAARSRSHALLVGMSSLPSPDAKGWRSRLFWSMHYFLARARDEVTSPLTPPANSLRARDDFGPSNMDIRHRLSSMVQGTLWHGFQLGSFFTITSAAPYNITTGFDRNLDTFFNDRPDGVTRNAARGAGMLQLGTRLSWSRGFGERKSSSGPGGVMVRMRVDGSGGMPDLPSFGGQNKANALLKMQLYIQAANVLNHTNATGFVGVATSPLFGMPTSAMPPRRIEIGTRFNF
ncbi:MAG: carboxypeptidase-like regulatory domain-containing protein [Bryobacteraceae bacterium]